MTTASDFASSLVDQLLASGSKVLENCEKASKISTDALKQIVDRQLELGSAFAELGAEQLKSLSTPGVPQDFLHRQKEASETFGAKLQSYFEALRGVAQETQQAYVQMGQDVAAGFSSKAV